MSGYLCRYYVCMYLCMYICTYSRTRVRTMYVQYIKMSIFSKKPSKIKYFRPFSSFSSLFLPFFLFFFSFFFFFFVQMVRATAWKNCRGRRRLCTVALFLRLCKGVSRLCTRPLTSLRVLIPNLERSNGQKMFKHSVPQDR